ncbi:hypothetical protein [Sphingomonas yabuuchiae]|uniref:hypothetical protein n=1 Tax=Sphingomonas yabuuchiae TaxID=172044 RepID=UPI00128EB85B|nr:hypothetical protein [Sphingomonas yabuuchiae]
MIRSFGVAANSVAARLTNGLRVAWAKNIFGSQPDFQLMPRQQQYSMIYDNAIINQFRTVAQFSAC